MSDETKWGEVRSACADKKWGMAWLAGGEGAAEHDDSGPTQCETYILDLATACGELPLAVMAWREAFGIAGYERLQRIAGWQESEAWLEGVTQMAKVVQGVTLAMADVVRTAAQTAQEIDRFARALAQPQRGPARRNRNML
jgi:hypothetical protein